MDLRTPWDDLDLEIDLMLSRKPIKLPAPGLYFSILPLRIAHNYREAQWNKANNATDLRAIIKECLDYERVIAIKILALESRNSSFPQLYVPAPVRPQTSNGPVPAPSPPPPPPSPSDSHLFRKRARATSLKAEKSPPSAKRVKFDMDGMKPTDSYTSSSTIETIPAYGRATPSQQSSFPITQTTDSALAPNIDPTPIICHYHSNIYKEVDTLHTLLTQAEPLENKLLSLHSQTVPTVSTPNHSDTSRDHLEQELSQLQSRAARVITELENSALAVRSGIGTGSIPLADFKAWDPRRRVVKSYDLQIECQMGERGLLMWWLG